MGLGTMSGGIVVTTGGTEAAGVILAGLIPIAFGALHLAHGVWSLETLGARPREGPSARVTLGPSSVGLAVQW